MQMFFDTAAVLAGPMHIQYIYSQINTGKWLIIEYFYYSVTIRFVINLSGFSCMYTSDYLHWELLLLQNLFIFWVSYIAAEDMKS